MKLTRNIFICGLMLSCAAAFYACTPKESPEAKAVIAESNYIEFEATGAAPAVITVYADGDWKADGPEWITVTPNSGSGTTEGVSISAADNKDGSGILLPRRDTITFHGAKLISYSYVTVYQKGDKYRGAVDATISTLASVKDGNFVNISGAQVMATDGKTVILSDGSTTIKLALKQAVKAGDILSFRGVKGSDGGQPVVDEIEDFQITSHSDVSYPAAKDLNATLDSFEASAPEYATVSGIWDGSSLSVEGASKTVAASGSEVDLGALTGHKAMFEGYVVATNASKVTMIVTKATDNGLDQLIYFKDDFEWLEPWSSAASAGNDVANNEADTNAAPNIFGTEGLADLVNEFNARGYGYVWGWKDQDWSDGTPDNGNKRTLYLQRNYLKFGKTSYNSGIILPAMSEISGKTDIMLEFDWCWSMTGAKKPDLMSLTSVITGEGSFENGSQEFGAIESAQATADDQTSLEWQHVSIRVNGVNSATRITLRPLNNDPSISNSRKQNRWYLDNILVTPAEGNGDIPGGEGVPSGTVLLDDDFEWVSTWATAASAGDSVTSNNPSATAPNVFTSEACAGFMEAFAEKGYTYLWAPTADNSWSDSLGDDNPKVLYLQTNYLKFGKTDVNAALKLPAFSAISGTADVELSFDWAWQITAKAKPDLMTLSIDVEDGGSYSGGEIESGQSKVDGESKIEWQHVSVTVSGIGPQSRITIRPTNANPNVSNPDRRQNRWFMDNVKVVVK